jgi:transposase-like protein
MTQVEVAWRVDDLVRATGIDGISKSEVSRVVAELDGEVAQPEQRPLDGAPDR